MQTQILSASLSHFNIFQMKDGSCETQIDDKQLTRQDAKNILQKIKYLTIGTADLRNNRICLDIGRWLPLSSINIRSSLVFFHSTTFFFHHQLLDLSQNPFNIPCLLPLKQLFDCSSPQGKSTAKRVQRRQVHYHHRANTDTPEADSGQQDWERLGSEGRRERHARGKRCSGNLRTGEGKHDHGWFVLRLWIARAYP